MRLETCLSRSGAAFQSRASGWPFGPGSSLMPYEALSTDADHVRETPPGCFTLPGSTAHD